jgi:hypothetical protein
LDEITQERYGNEIDANGWLVSSEQAAEAVAHK